MYETFTEEDYRIIWETYSYSDFSWDFGKLNSSEAKPRRSSLKPEVFKIYKQQVQPLHMCCWPASLSIMTILLLISQPLRHYANI